MPNTTLPANPSALPAEWIDRLFARLSVVYGKHLADLWADVPLPEVKAAWARTLARYEPEALRRALEHCEHNLKFPPTLPEFAALCRDFRRANTIANTLPAPAAPMPAELSAAVAEMGEQNRRHPRAWARRIMQRKDAGDHKLPRISVEYAAEVLGGIPQREPGSDDQ